jgi:hypothetical protein
VWHPVRPQRTDDSVAPATSDSAPAAVADNHSDSSTSKDAACHDKTQCNDKTPCNDKAQCSDKSQCNAGAKVTAQKKSVVTAGFDDGASGDPLPVNSKIRLVVGQSSPVSNKASSNVALTDPFGDNLPSVQSHRIAMAPPDDVDSIPEPQQNTTSPMRIEQAQQDPVELSPPEPLRSGLPKHTVKASQAEIPGPPAPDLLPGADQSQSYSKLPQRSPEEACRAEYDRIKAITLSKLSIDIVPPGNQAKGDQVPFECGLSTDEFAPRCWPKTTYTWKASALCHKPLYFEDDGLERYGHSWGPLGFEDAQTCIHFFGDLVLLPYMVGVYTPGECDYDLGYYRPGDCAPWIADPFPLSCRGLVTGAIGYSGVAALLP